MQSSYAASTAKSSDDCPQCGKTTDNLTSCIDGCQIWSHASCVQLSDNDVETNSKIDAWKWFCSACLTKFDTTKLDKTVITEVEMVKSTVERHQEDFQTLAENFKQLHTDFKSKQANAVEEPLKIQLRIKGIAESTATENHAREKTWSSKCSQ